jgi:hypothetical protein
MAVAMLALFVALGGTAFALARNEVRSRHIKNGHVRIADIDGEAVTNAKLAPLSVSTGKIQNSAVDTPQIAADAVDTPQIAADAVDTAEIADDAVEAPQIATGAVGSAEIGGSAVKATELGTLTVRSNGETVLAGQTGTAIAPCNASEQVVSGGGEWANLNDTAIGNSEPSGNGWKIAGDNLSSAGQTLTAHAFCLEV